MEEQSDNVIDIEQPKENYLEPWLAENIRIFLEEYAEHVGAKGMNKARGLIVTYDAILAVQNG